jgi:D-arabinose 1-dehydrogenase-like Zn-dependent alcohol dehydrogenase
MNGTTSTIAPQEEQQSAPAKSHSAKAYAAESATSGLAPTSIQRRAPRPQDVEIEILYCGVCHSDLHQVRDEWHAFMPTVYPCVPGHEIVGRVTRIGSAVKKFKRVISPLSVAWSTPAACARIAAKDSSSTATTGSHLPTTAKTRS